MANNIIDLIKGRNDFLKHLENDIHKYDQTIKSLTEEQEHLESLITNLKNLKIYPEREAIIPLGKNIFMKGKIVHTGEYYVKRTAHPDSIVTLQTADQTIGRLEEEIKLKANDIDKAEYGKFQIEERIKIFKGEESFQVENSNSPKEIKSDKGVAIKVGDYYEILEFEE